MFHLFCLGFFFFPGLIRLMLVCFDFCFFPAFIFRESKRETYTNRKNIKVGG